MIAIAFTLFAATVILGGILLIPRIGVLTRVRRGVLAVSHGLAGASGLAALYATIILQPRDGPLGWTAAGLITLGLMAGLAIFATTRHRRPPPVLTLALHIVFAGMGAMLLIGLALS